MAPTYVCVCYPLFSAKLQSKSVAEPKERVVKYSVLHNKTERSHIRIITLLGIGERQKGAYLRSFLYVSVRIQYFKSEEDILRKLVRKKT